MEALLEKIAPALVTGAVSVFVAFTIYLFNRKQARIDTTFDMHREYYSEDFARSRDDAKDFALQCCFVDWSKSDPYEIVTEPEKRKGYSQLVRFYHRLAVLDHRGRLDRQIAADLFSRELGVWFGLLFEPMRSRSDWWTKPLIYRMARNFDAARGRGLLSKGLFDGRRQRNAERDKN